MSTRQKNIKIKKDSNLQDLLSLEWLDTNSIGGYASSTVINCHTRKYHGLLVAKLHKPAGKFVLLSTLEDSILLGQNEFFLSSHKYPGGIYPEGYKNQTSFSLNGLPSFNYKVENSKVKKELLLLDKENTLLIKYSGFNKKATLRIKPLLAFKDFHNLSRKNSSLQTKTNRCKKGFSISPYQGMPKLFLQSNKTFKFLHSPDWHLNFEFIKERDRGFDYHEDLFVPGVIEVDLKKGEEIILSFSIKEQKDSISKKWNQEVMRRTKKTKKLKGSFFQKSLQEAASQFIVEDLQGNKSIIAGYHWFLSWGRDAMIALPGLALYSGREKDCLEILKTFAKNEKAGIIPNFIGNTIKENAYNSVDASLWFAWAIQKYIEKTNDIKSVKTFLWPTLKRIFLNYKKGTLFDIKMLYNGLLRAGNQYTQVTWMDATAYNKPVTPRNGCPVEINALWYNFVCLIDELRVKFKDKTIKQTSDLKEKIKESFNKHFWVDKENYLGDVYNGYLDKTIRSNQIFAVSLPYSPLDKKRGQNVVSLIEKELLTPRGLRTLSPKDSNFCGRYEGNGDQRDSSYHNGAVWPWLMGHYGEACLKTADNKKQSAAKIKKYLKQFEDHLQEAGLFTISEIFDATPPQNPHGCISQAWSVAELLRLSYLIEKI